MLQKQYSRVGKVFKKPAFLEGSVVPNSSSNSVSQSKIQFNQLSLTNVIR